MGDPFENAKKNFGFGFMRLPQKDGEIDLDETQKMVDLFMARGFNYFDTAHVYHSGNSETALRTCLTSRYPRESYVLVDKLSGSCFQTEEDIRPLFATQLEACGVDYFDIYLMHSQGAKVFEKFKQCRAYETAFALKEEGKIRHVGLSFHDKAEVLDRILTEYPQIEAVQIQFNYLDYENPSVEGRQCYEVCRKHNKPVIVMEPVKGGQLVKLPESAVKVLAGLHGGSPASYAVRYAASFEGIKMVLSGMSTMEQLEDNLGYMQDFKPLTEEEFAAVNKVREILIRENRIPCTACRYCTDGCPVHIDIPSLFSCMNARQVFSDWNSDYYYELSIANNGKASDCIKCGKCEQICPQHLNIRELLVSVAEAFDKKPEEKK